MGCCASVPADDPAETHDQRSRDVNAVDEQPRAAEPPAEDAASTNAADAPAAAAAAPAAALQPARASSSGRRASSAATAEPPTTGAPPQSSEWREVLAFAGDDGAALPVAGHHVHSTALQVPSGAFCLLDLGKPPAPPVASDLKAAAADFRGRSSAGKRRTAAATEVDALLDSLSQSAFMNTSIGSADVTPAVLTASAVLPDHSSRRFASPMMVEAQRLYDSDEDLEDSNADDEHIEALFPVPFSSKALPSERAPGKPPAGFAAHVDEDDCRRAATAQTPHMIAARYSLIETASRQAAGLLCDEDEFLSAERKTLLCAAPVLVMEMREAAAREDLSLTWWARAAAMQQRLLGNLAFLAHDHLAARCSRAHATFLVAAVHNLALRVRATLEAEELQGVVRLAMPFSFKIAKQAEWAEERRQMLARREAAEFAAATALAERKSAALKQNRAKWQEYRGKLGTAPAAPLHPRIALVQQLRQTTAVAAVDGKSRREQRFAAERGSLIEEEARHRSSVSDEAAARLNAVLLAADDLIVLLDIPLGRVARMRHDARVARANITARAIQARVVSGGDNATVPDARPLSTGAAHAALFVAESEESKRKAAVTWLDEHEAMLARESMCRAVCATHDRRRADAAAAEAAVIAQRLQEQAAVALIARSSIGALWRQRLSVLPPVAVEVRSICGDQRRLEKQLLQCEVVEWHDMLMYHEACLRALPGYVADTSVVVQPHCLTSVELFGRHRLHQEWAACWTAWQAEHAATTAAAARLPLEMRGHRVRAAHRLQALWRGMQFRRHFAAELRDVLILHKMRVLRLKGEVRALCEIEAHRRFVIEDEEVDADLYGRQHETLRASVVARHAACTRIAAWWRGCSWRRWGLNRLKEDFWMLKYQRLAACKRSQ